MDIQPAKTLKLSYKDDMRRIQYNIKDIESLYKEVAHIYDLKEGSFTIKYTDEEDDLITILTDEELKEYLKIANNNNILKFTVVKKTQKRKKEEEEIKEDNDHYNYNYNYNRQPNSNNNGNMDTFTQTFPNQFPFNQFPFSFPFGNNNHHNHPYNNQ
eukprot:TRINITY_DN2838_c0_g1_i1.p2 TRINITY_DN2838_c0_g1~~TRINITY_DN2838_c0_g1_i1.p2  ORF type:complete len:157 (-),score=50.02 TRINITY_DN2838_c0_g1_i1:417-887(-)